MTGFSFWRMQPFFHLASDKLSQISMQTGNSHNKRTTQFPSVAGAAVPTKVSMGHLLFYPGHGHPGSALLEILRTWSESASCCHSLGSGMSKTAHFPRLVIFVVAVWCFLTMLKQRSGRPSMSCSKRSQSLGRKSKMKNSKNVQTRLQNEAFWTVRFIASLLAMGETLPFSAIPQLPNTACTWEDCNKICWVTVSPLGAHMCQCRSMGTPEIRGIPANLETCSVLAVNYAFATFWHNWPDLKKRFNVSKFAFNDCCRETRSHPLDKKKMCISWEMWPWTNVRSGSVLPPPQLSINCGWRYISTCRMAWLWAVSTKPTILMQPFVGQKKRFSKKKLILFLPYCGAPFGSGCNWYNWFKASFGPLQPSPATEMNSL